jgi:spore coat polysaccharide biosynthesis protein SpsF
VLPPDRVAIVVQARVGSTRFPGKVLAPFGGSTLLGHIVARLRDTAQLWVATTTNAEDDEIERLCHDAGVGVFRGSADDVLGRFAACIEQMPQTPELVVRMCADRPFACPRLIKELFDAYDDAGAPDYLSNTLPRKSFPDGFDVEIARTPALLEAAADAADPYEREHVTPFLYRNPERFDLAGLPCPYGDFSSVRATIDTPEDYEALRVVHSRLGEQYDYRDVLTLATLEPGRFP